MHGENGAGRVLECATVIVEVGAVRRSDLADPGAAPREDIGNPKRAADLDQLAARDRARRGRRRAWSARTSAPAALFTTSASSAPVSRRSRVRQCSMRCRGCRWRDRTRGSSSPPRRRRRRRSRRGQGRAPEVGVQHDAGGIEHRPRGRFGAPRRGARAMSVAQSSGGPARRVRAASSEARTAESTAARGDLLRSSSMRGSRSSRSTDGSWRRAIGHERFFGRGSEPWRGQRVAGLGQRIAAPARRVSRASRLGTASTPFTSPVTPLTLRTPRSSSSYLRFRLPRDGNSDHELIGKPGPGGEGLVDLRRALSPRLAVRFPAARVAPSRWYPVESCRGPRSRARLARGRAGYRPGALEGSRSPSVA